MTRTALPAAILIALVATSAANAGPTATLGTVLTTERPYTATQVDTMKKLSSFGLCDAPQNADDLPTSPVPVQEDSCAFYQTYEATSAGPSHGGSCGGYTVAFGPMGDLKTNWKRYTLRASYGEALTQAQCTNARLAAVAWGVRCLNDDCSSTQWERIGTPLSKKGTWYSNQNRCALEHQFIDVQHRYTVLNIDAIASLQEGGQSVRKRAHAFIRAERGNGKCFSASQPARQTPLQPASQATGTYTPQSQKRP
jgi:hypothetical protein